MHMHMQVLWLVRTTTSNCQGFVIVVATGSCTFSHRDVTLRTLLAFAGLLMDSAETLKKLAEDVQLAVATHSQSNDNKNYDNALATIQKLRLAVK